MSTNEPGASPFSGSPLPASEPVTVHVRSSVPHTVGVLCIVFGSLFILCGLQNLLSAIIAPYMGQVMGGMTNQMSSLQENERAQRIERMSEQLANSNDAAEQKRIQAEIDRIQALPPVKVPDFSKLMPQLGTGVMTWSIIDGVTAILTHVGMIIAGIMLVGKKESGRKLAVWVMAIKIPRLIISQLYNVIFVVPQIVKSISGWMAEFAEQSPTPPPPDFQQTMTTVYGIMYSAMAIIPMLIGVACFSYIIYLLTRPHVIASLNPEGVDIGKDARILEG